MTAPLHARVRTFLPPTRPAGVPLRAPVHPGRFLERQYLQPLGINQTQAAQLLGVSRRRVNELVMGHRAMSADTALRCAMAFGTPAAYWLTLQAHWDCFHAWRTLRAQVRAGQASAPACADSVALHATPTSLPPLPATRDAHFAASH
jgi:addiction module HigA family antidote